MTTCNPSENPYFQLLLGDCRERLKDLPDNSVQCCVCSPPYFSLRKYSDSDKEIGTEKEVYDYVNNIVEAFREVRRVLRDDGVLWLNLGDSYNGSGGQGTKPRIISKKAAKNRGGKSIRCKELKKGDLIGIPWRCAFALQSDGWFLRCDNIWFKANAMPESVKSRPTRAHEYVFLFSKSQHYFYDWWAISEPTITDNPTSSREYREDIGRGSGNREADNFDTESGKHAMGNRVDGRKNKRSVWKITNATSNNEDHYAVMPGELAKTCILAGTSVKGCCYNCGTPWIRNMTSCIEGIAPIAPIERNGTLLTPEDSAIVEYIETHSGDYRVDLMGDKHHKLWTGEQSTTGGKTGQFRDKGYALTYWGAGNNMNWEPGCECRNRDAVDAWDMTGVEVPEFPTVPCVVLDPFNGSGTSRMEALKLGRSYVGVELNPKYLENSRKKMAALDPMFVEEKK